MEKALTPAQKRAKLLNERAAKRDAQKKETQKRNDEKREAAKAAFIPKVVRDRQKTASTLKTSLNDPDFSHYAELRGGVNETEDLTEARYPQATSWNGMHAATLHGVISELSDRLISAKEYALANKVQAASDLKAGKISANAARGLGKKFSNLDTLHRNTQRDIKDAQDALANHYATHAAGGHEYDALGWLHTAGQKIMRVANTLQKTPSTAKILARPYESHPEDSGLAESTPSLLGDIKFFDKKEFGNNVATVVEAYKDHLRTLNGGEELPGVTNNPKFSTAEFTLNPVGRDKSSITKPKVAKPEGAVVPRAPRPETDPRPWTLGDKVHEIMRDSIKPHWMSKNKKANEQDFLASSAALNPRAYAQEHGLEDPYPHDVVSKVFTGRNVDAATSAESAHKALRMALGDAWHPRFDAGRKIDAKSQNAGKKTEDMLPEENRAAIEAKINSDDRIKNLYKITNSRAKTRFTESTQENIAKDALRSRTREKAGPSFEDYKEPSRSEPQSAEALASTQAAQLMSGNTGLSFIGPPETPRAPTGRSSVFHSTVQAHSEGGQP